MWLVAEWLQHEAASQRLALGLQRVKDISTECPVHRTNIEVPILGQSIELGQARNIICLFNCSGVYTNI
jgi:hypothetical protein